MIIQDISSRKVEALDLMYEVFSPYFPNQPRSWFDSQVHDINWNLSLGFEKEGKLIAIYLVKPSRNFNFKKELKGLRGDALAVKKEERGQKIAEQFLAFIKENYDFDYLWGTQDKKLENLPFWLKHRFVVEETNSHYITAQYLK